MVVMSLEVSCPKKIPLSSLKGKICLHLHKIVEDAKKYTKNPLSNGEEKDVDMYDGYEYH